MTRPTLRTTPRAFRRRTQRQFAERSPPSSSRPCTWSSTASTNSVEKWSNKFFMLTKKERRIFWEVYSGSANLSATMESYGWDVVSFDYLTGWDFDLAAHRREFLDLQDKVCPDFIWFSPKCTEWSPLQQLGMTEYKRRALQAEREYQEKVHLKMVRRSYLKQRREGRHGAIEQPRYAISWKTRTFHDLPGHPCLLDQCQFEAMMPDSDGKDQYIKKPTRLQCTDEGMANQLSLLCPGDHYHLPFWKGVHQELETELLLQESTKESSATASATPSWTSSSTRTSRTPTS